MGTTPRPRVIVGVDTSIPGLAALRSAVAEAARRGAVLHAARAGDDFALGDVTRIDEAFAAAFGGYPAGVAVRREMLFGPPAEALTRRAHRSSDLLVVGTHGRGPWRAALSGSVSRACLRRATCPVLVVPPPETAYLTRRERRSLLRGGGGGPAPVSNVP
jgi:nucleotide-binding universal stress UspA family protein